MFAAENLIKKCAKDFEEAFLKSVKIVREEINLNSYEDLKYIESLEFDKYLSSLTQFKPLILSTIALSAKETEKPRDTIYLDLDKAVNLHELNRLTTNLMKDLLTTQRESIKKLISDGIEKNYSYKSIKTRIIPKLGLNLSQVNKLKTMEDNLLQSNTSLTAIEKILSQKSKQMLSMRAETIALTESARAVASGRHLIQQQMFEDGDIKENSTQEWLTGSDERTCTVCGPMNGQKQSLKEYFTTGNGQSVLCPILHPRCRCIVVLNF